MKRMLCCFFAAVIGMLSLFPFTAYATDYTLTDTDISVTIDEDAWLVFTRDNIKDNPLVEQMGSSYEEILENYQKEHIYLDAALLGGNETTVEFFIRKSSTNTGAAQLSDYSDKEAEKYVKALAEKTNAKDYSLYKTKYKFAKLEYIDSKLDYYICEYVTLVNKDNYALTFQSPNAFTDSDYEQMTKIVENVRFDVDPSLKNASPFLSSVITKVIAAAMIGGGSVLVGALIKKKKGKQEETAPTEDTPV